MTKWVFALLMTVLLFAAGCSCTPVEEVHYTTRPKIDWAGDSEGPYALAVWDSEGEDVVNLSDEGDNAGSGSFVTLATIILQNSMDYKNLEWIASCFREATFEMVWIDDVGGADTETILGTVKCGSGSYTSSGRKAARFTTGGSGVQHLIIRAANLNALSQLEGAICVEEVQ